MAYSLNQSGIYCIINKINNKKYIGQSISVLERMEDHKRRLNLNQHYNIYLQRAWNKYGENNFLFDVLEFCEIEELNNKEKYYIEQFNTYDNSYGYNLTLGGDGIGIRKEESIEKQVNTYISKYGIKIYQIDLNGDVIKEWDNISEAARFYNVDVTSIHKCLVKKAKTCKGYIWIYKDDYCNFDIEFYINKFYKRPIIQLNNDYKFIKSWNSIKEAAYFYSNKSNSSSISGCLKKRQQTAHGFRWMYEEEYFKECGLTDIIHTVIK